MTIKRASYNRQDGFTLTEVLVAMAILSVGVVTLLSLISQNIRITSDMEQRLMAGIVAENILVETLAPFTLPENMALEGETRFAGRTWRWRRSLNETVVEGFYRITVDVQPENSDQIIGSVTAFREGA